ncbi:MAG: hypothetical protein LBK66_08345 [Spirochaetaceae bacterium]|jgi:hypothetical protein|nr:hypothetical protein [Spirochaetaceae bacterium]
MAKKIVLGLIITALTSALIFAQEQEPVQAQAQEDNTEKSAVFSSNREGDQATQAAAKILQGKRRSDLIDVGSWDANTGNALINDLRRIYAAGGDRQKQLDRMTNEDLVKFLNYKNAITGVNKEYTTEEALDFFDGKSGGITLQGKNGELTLNQNDWEEKLEILYLEAGVGQPGTVNEFVRRKYEDYIPYMDAPPPPELAAQEPTVELKPVDEPPVELEVVEVIEEIELTEKPAQTEENWYYSYSELVKENKFLINAGIGYSAAPYEMRVPPISASVEYMLQELPLSVGGYFGMSMNKADYGVARYSDTTMGFGARASWHLNLIKTLDTYISLTLGWVIWQQKVEDTRTEYAGGFIMSPTSAEINRGTILLGFNIGARYFFTKNVGAYLEVGYNVVSVLSIGLSLKF